jgi:hypothetical protein
VFNNKVVNVFLGTKSNPFSKKTMKKPRCVTAAGFSFLNF